MPYAPLGLDALYLDFDSFFASAEQHLCPELRGRPVGVVPTPTEFTCLIAASREAKVFGFKVGTPVREARRICPEIIIRHARPDVYVRLHKQILACIDRVVPIRAVRSIDEVVCDLMWNEQARARDLALDIKAALARDIGPTLTCSIGIAPNELLAKIAAEMNKPDGLVIIRPEELPEVLYPLKLKDIPGIGSGNAARLERAGVRDVRSLLALAPKQMRALWGSIEGERLHTALHGGKVIRPPTRRGMFGHSRILPPHWRKASQIAGCARLMLVKAARRMRKEGYAAGCLLLSLRSPDRVRWQNQKRFAPVQDDHSLIDALRHLLRMAHAEGSLAGAKTVHVLLLDLVPAADRAPDLFTSAVMEREHQRWERLTAVTDRLSARFGHTAAMLGVHEFPPGGYVGQKIAFGMVPEGEEIIHDLMELA